MTVLTPGSPGWQEGGGESPPRPSPRGHASHSRGQSLQSAEQVTVIPEFPGSSAEVQGRARFGDFSCGIDAVFAHCTPPGGGVVFCVSGRVQSAHPSPSGVAGPQPHEVPSQPRPGPCIRVGAQSTLGPRVKVQRSHALGALPCPAPLCPRTESSKRCRPSGAGKLAPQDQYIPLPPPGRTRGSDAFLAVWQPARGTPEPARKSATPPFPLRLPSHSGSEPPAGFAFWGAQARVAGLLNPEPFIWKFSHRRALFPKFNSS